MSRSPEPSDPPQESETYASDDMVITCGFGEGNRPTIPDSYHHNFISFLSLAQHLRIDLMSLSWQPALPGLGAGASSQIAQSNALTKQLSFAFKRTTPRRRGAAQTGAANSDSKRFRALTCEILVLRNPAIREHRNINQLEGIAWEHQDGAVWPVLVFAKANCGSLRSFMVSERGKDLDFEAKLRLCIDVALALHTLHQNNIIHGDIKPDNILVFGTADSYVAKVTDFESSCVSGSGDDLVMVQRTTPWEALEWHERYFTTRDAKLLDVFSFGLLCLWILFQENVEEDLTKHFNEFKANDQFTELVQTFLSLWSDLSPHQNDCLLRFFKSTVCVKREDRETNFEKLIRLLSFDEEFSVLPAELTPMDSSNFHYVLSIVPEFRSLSLADYRVRTYLEKSLKSMANDAGCTDCAAQAAFQLALGWKTGFFLPEDEITVEENVLQSGRDSAELEDEVKEIRLTPNPTLPIPRTAAVHGIAYPTDLVHQYWSQGLLSQAEEHLRQEVHARCTILGRDHFLTLLAMDSLASILRANYRWRECQELLQQVLQSQIKFGGDENAHVVLLELASLKAEEGHWAEAESLQKRVLKVIKEVCGDKHTITLEIMMDLAGIYHGQGRLAEAVEIIQTVIHGFEEELGAEHLRTVAAIEQLAASLVKLGQWKKALEIAERVVTLKTRLIGSNHPQTLESEKTVGQIYRDMGNLDESVKRLKKVIETQIRTVGEMQMDTLSSMDSLAATYLVQGKLQMALELEQEIFQKRELVLGTKHPQTLRSMARLGTLHGELGNLDTAMDFLSRVIQAREDLFGKMHPDTLSGKGVMAGALRKKGLLEEAEKLGIEVLEGLCSILGEKHPDTLDSMADLAATYIARSRLAEASALLKSAIEYSVEMNGLYHQTTLTYKATLCATIPEPSEAEAIQREVLGREQELFGVESPSVLVGMNNMAVFMMQQEQWAKAEEILLQILPLSKEVLGPAHQTTMSVIGNLAGSRCEQGHWSEAQESYEDAVAILTDKFGEEHHSTLTQRSNLALVLKRIGKLDDAVKLNETVLRTMDKVHGERHAETMRVMNNLAACYVELKRWGDAQRQMEQLTQIAEEEYGKDDGRTKRHQADLDAVRSSS